LFRECQRQLRRLRDVKRVRSAFFFLLFYFYLWLEVDPRLIYHGGGFIPNFPVFYANWSFLFDSISYPGGPTEYISAFLSQLFYWSWVGALIITVLAWLLFVSVEAYINTIRAPGLRFLRIAGPVVLFITYGQYTYQFATLLAFLAAISFAVFYFYLRGRPHSTLRAVATYLVFSAVLNYLAGGAHSLFVLLCIIAEVLFGPRWLLCLLYLATAIITPYIEGVILCGMSTVDTFTILLPWSWQSLAYILYYPLSGEIDASPPTAYIGIVAASILYVLIPLTTIPCGLWRVVVRRRQSRQPQTSMPSFRGHRASWRFFIRHLILVLIIAAAVAVIHNHERKALFEVDYYAYRKRWSDVLASAALSTANVYVRHAANRSLYHTGRLGDEMFHFSQHPDDLFLSTDGRRLRSFNPERLASHRVQWRVSEIHMDLGLHHVAEFDLLFLMEFFGERPMILQRRALLSMAKGDNGAAQICLGALATSLFHSKWANHYLERLRVDPGLTDDEEVQRLRRVMMKEDPAPASFDYIDAMKFILQENPHNRMAFEYLMSLYLLNKQLDDFARNLHRLDDFDYQEIPVHYEEAILLHTSGMEKYIDLHGRRVRSETLLRFQGFQSMREGQRGNGEEGADSLARQYGTTYWFYYTFCNEAASE